jgi:hypothetical protein
MLDRDSFSATIGLIQLRLQQGSQVVLKVGEVATQVQGKDCSLSPLLAGAPEILPEMVSATGCPAIFRDTGTGGISNVKSALRIAAGNAASTIHAR